MTALAGVSVGLVGGLAALPMRLAEREVAARGGTLHRGVTRATGIVVFGRRLLARGEPEAKVAAARGGGRVLRSENGFLRLLAGEAAPPGLERREMLERSGLAAPDLDLLALFDGFERDVAPFGFRDLILARKYAGLIAGGAGWAAILRSVHRFGPAVSLTAKSLRLGEGAAIYACHGDAVSELDGQLLLGLGAAEEDAEEVFARAEAAEAEGRHGEAAALYGRCLAIDPADAVAAFNRANCLAAEGRAGEAEAELVRALKLDPGFVEAWFNLAGLAAARGGVAAARAALGRAIGLDAGYGDAVYNLAQLEFDAGDFAAARRWWQRYLELDGTSEWARTAARGLRYLDLAEGAAG